MKQKISITIDEWFYWQLKNSPVSKTGKNLSRTLEHYAMLGLSIGNRLELATPAIIDDLVETTARVQARRKLETTNASAAKGSGSSKAGKAAERAQSQDNNNGKETFRKMLS